MARSETANGDARNGGRRPSVVVIVKEFPQISQTYIRCEIAALSEHDAVHVLTRREPDLTYPDHHDFTRVDNVDHAVEFVREVGPDVIHTHYLNQVAFTGAVSERTQIPFTVRSHSFDVLALRRKGLRGRVKERVRAKLAGSTTLARSPEFRSGMSRLGERDGLCLGVLAFPFARDWLRAAGVADDLIVDTFPAVDVERFHDESPNGEGVMNTGVATPKKQMEDFFDLAPLVPERQFRLYAMGYHVDELQASCRKRDADVEFVPPVDPSDMPAEYKRHQWLVYTADFDLATVGWPMAVAEAQASGVGVCMPRIRADLAEYVGAGGHLYDSIDEVAAIIREPVPADLRTAGFTQAKRSDIRQSLHQLTDLW